MIEYFEEAETSQEYNGYFCSIPEAISIVLLVGGADAQVIGLVGHKVIN